MRNRSRQGLHAVLAMVVVLLAACGPDPAPPGTATGEATAGEDPAPAAGPTEPGAPLTVYSGRNEELVGPLFTEFTEETGIELRVRYGDTAELAATILEEGANSPADVYVAQDAGGLGALGDEGLLAELPGELLDVVEERFRAGDGTWVGLSGRARVLAYDTGTLAEDEVPGSVLDLTDERWRGRVGWAPTNGSFQAFVTAMRAELGDDATREWVEAMIANDARTYDNNSAIVEAVGRGEAHLGLVNHYYLYRFLEEDPGFPAANAFLDAGDVGALVNVAGAGILGTSDQGAAATRLVEFLLGEDAQRYFAEETYEYPLARGVPADDRLPALETITTPELDLSDLEDLQGTLELLRQAGALS